MTEEVQSAAAPNYVDPSGSVVGETATNNNDHKNGIDPPHCDCDRNHNNNLKSSDGSDLENESDIDSSDDADMLNILESKLLNRISNPDLPETVVKLECFPPADIEHFPSIQDETGQTKPFATVYVVGTAHFSRESQEDVRKTIVQTQPDCIMVELCESRTSILSMDEEKLLEEAKNLNMEKIMVNIRQSGVVQGVLHCMLLSMSAHITKQLGMAPGGEFRAAFQELQKMPACRLHLGDRPIQVTLQRAFGTLSAWQKLRLFGGLLWSHGLNVTKEDIEKAKNKDLLEEILREMAGEFPDLSRIFVEERDQYMAQMLQCLARTLYLERCQLLMTNDRPFNDIEKFPVSIVAVVGIGHQPGIAANWNKKIDIPSLMRYIVFFRFKESTLVMFDSPYRPLWVLFIIVMISNINGFTKDEGNLIKLLAVLGNDYIKFKSDLVKVKFWTCVERAGGSVKKYARCLIKLLNSKNSTRKSKESQDNLMLHDLKLVKSYQKRPVKQESYQLLNHRPNDRMLGNLAPASRVSIPDLIHNIVSMHYSVKDGSDQSSRIIRYVSNFFKFLSHKYPKSISNFRLLSPRFLSTEPDTTNQSRLLSPDLFDLHNNASEHSVLSLSKFLDQIPTDESSMWRKFINETLTTMKDDVIRTSWNQAAGEIIKEYKLDNVTVRNKVKEFYDTLDEQQLKDMYAKGYTMLKDYQLNEIQHNEKYKYNLNSEAMIQQALNEAILNLANGRSGHRGKRALAKGCLLKASVGSEEALSNYIVSHIILCPSAVGYYALGSLVLTPFILSPYVLAPFLLSTFVLMPFILSPAALSPAILAPGVLSPSILNPVVLSPFLLSPLVLSPTVLGPFCLSPILLSPSVLSPVALSPDVLSPVVLSPCAGC